VIAPFGRQLILFVTRSCPLRCMHCFLRDEWSSTAGREISIEEAARLGREAAPISQLSLSGGEPSDRDDLPELVQALAEESGVRHIDLPSAGWDPQRVSSMTERILETGNWQRVSLNLSLDGHAELHDRIRGVNGSYDRLVETYGELVKLKSRGPLVLKVVVTLMKATAHALPDIVRALQADFPHVDHVHVEPYRGRDRGEGIAPPSAEEMRADRKLVFGLYDSGDLGGHGRFGLGGLSAAMKKVVYDEYARLLDGHKPRIMCRAPWFSLVVTETMDLAFCEPGPILGNLREKSLREILDGPGAQRERERIGRGCACTHSCFMQPSALLSPAAWSRLPAMLLLGRGSGV